MIPFLNDDQIEAVLMRRASYDVRVLVEEGGSWEENPPHLAEFIRRDLRWCQGNMQYWHLLGRVHRLDIAPNATSGISMDNLTQLKVSIADHIATLTMDSPPVNGITSGLAAVNPHPGTRRNRATWLD